MTTTAEAIRSNVSTRIEALTPPSATGDRFRAHREELPIAEWAEANPQGCFRRFSVRWVGSVRSPYVSNTDVTLVEQDLDVTVAYPTTWRDRSGKQLAGLDDTILRDLHKLNHTIGTEGFSALASSVQSATVRSHESGEEVVTGPVVSFGVVHLTATYYRSNS